MTKDELATYLVARLSASELLDAFDCWSDDAQALGEKMVDQLAEQSTSGAEFVERYNAACDAQNAEYERLGAEIRRMRAATRRANKRIRELGAG
jgi:hypothetical protein